MNEALNTTIIAGLAATFVWLAKVVGEKLINHFFEQKKEAEKTKDEMAKVRIDNLKKSITDLEFKIKGLEEKIEKVTRKMELDSKARVMINQKIKDLVVNLESKHKEVEDRLNDFGKVIVKER